MQSRTDMGATGNIERAAWTLTRLEKIGVAAPASNRLDRAKRLLEEVQNDPSRIDPDDDNLLQRLAEAQLAVQQMFIVVRELGLQMDRQGWQLEGLLTEMLGGADTEEQDTNTKHRNFQFELYVGALLRMGNATVIPGEPDWRLVGEGIDVGIAAKRISSTQKLLPRYKAAVEQIDRHGGEGFVALSVDPFVKRRGSGDHEEPSQEEFVTFTTIVDQIAEEIRDQKPALGVMFFGHVLLWLLDATPPRFQFHNMFSIRIAEEPREQNDMWHRYFEEVHRVMGERLKALRG